MSGDHDRYRHDGLWLPFYADGYVMTGATATTLPGCEPPRTQPIGFHGAAPGASLDERGLPRLRVKARSRPA